MSGTIDTDAVLSQVKQGSVNSNGTDCHKGASQVLVVGADDWAIEHAALELKQAGRRVHRCQDSAESPFPCNALVPARGCPLDKHDVDVVLDVRARPQAEPSLGEMGAICGLRAGLPLVVAGLSEAMRLAPWAAKVPADGDIVTSCDEAVRGRV